jgi:hypothetical protein
MEISGFKDSASKQKRLDYEKRYAESIVTYGLFQDLG